MGKNSDWPAFVAIGILILYFAWVFMIAPWLKLNLWWLTPLVVIVVGSIFAYKFRKVWLKYMGKIMAYLDTIHLILRENIQRLVNLGSGNLKVRLIICELKKLAGVKSE